jgi:high-affinity nickel-transport protein
LTLTLLLAAFAAFVLGIRHGLDWDHLSAIADLVGSPGRQSQRSLGLAVWYCIGHGTVIVLLGAMVGLLGVRLPGGLDRVFEVVVGLTLVGLGLLVLVQVARLGRSYRFTSRWRLLLDLLRRVWLRRRGEVAWDRPADGVSSRAAFAIGVLHGTGAETPTQVVLFASAAAAGSTAGALLVLVAFVSGLIASDVGVALVWLTGRLQSTRVPFGQPALGILTGVASIGVGSAFILEKSAVLPSLLGG